MNFVGHLSLAYCIGCPINLLKPLAAMLTVFDFVFGLHILVSKTFGESRCANPPYGPLKFCADQWNKNMAQTLFI